MTASQVKLLQDSFCREIVKHWLRISLHRNDHQCGARYLRNVQNRLIHFVVGLVIPGHGLNLGGHLGRVDQH